MKSLKFYDLSARESFTSNEYEKSSKITNGVRRYYAKTISPSGTKTTRIISKADFMSE